MASNDFHTAKSQFLDRFVPAYSCILVVDGAHDSLKYNFVNANFLHFAQSVNDTTPQHPKCRHLQNQLHAPWRPLPVALSHSDFLDVFHEKVDVVTFTLNPDDIRM